MADRIGPTFGVELARAGLGGLPVVWTPAGDVHCGDGMTDAQVAAVDAVLAAHDPVASVATAAAAQTRRDLVAELDAIDAASARPLRAILAAQAAGGTADAADVAKIAELEAQAVALRAELAALG
jgi:hypothetical protein